MHKNSNNPERKAKILLVFSMFVWVDVWVGGRLFSCGWVPILTSQPGKVIWSLLLRLGWAWDRLLASLFHRYKSFINIPLYMGL